jgi:hypothetical protein
MAALFFRLNMKLILKERIKTYFDATYGNIGLNYDQCPEVFLLDASSERYLFPTEDMLWCLFPDPRYHGKLLNSPAHPLHIPKNPLPL